MELILGTAQLTRPYGLMADATADDPERAFKLLKEAVELGIRTLDTAPVYGDAETCIGASVHAFGVHTKLHPEQDPEASLTASLERLRRARVDVLYLHDPEALADPVAVAAAHLLVGDRVGSLGASVYTERALKAAAEDDRIGVVQVPLNLLDRRIEDRLLEDVAASGTRVVARSVLLQGLLASPDSAKGRVVGLDAALSRVTAASAAVERDPVELAIGWVKARPGLDGMVLGAENAGQLRTLAAAFDAPALEASELELLQSLVGDEVLPVDPRGWTS